MSDRESVAAHDVALEALEDHDRGVRDFEDHLIRIGGLVDAATERGDIPTMTLARRLYRAVVLLGVVDRGDVAGMVRTALSNYFATEENTHDE